MRPRNTHKSGLGAFADTFRVNALDAQSQLRRSKSASLRLEALEVRSGIAVALLDPHGPGNRGLRELLHGVTRAVERLAAPPNLCPRK
jgi:hypothetical protein